MKFRVILTGLVSFVVFTHAGLTSTLEYQVQDSIQCNANYRGGSTINSATIHDLEQNKKLINFSGTFEAKNFFNYTGTFRGKAKMVGDELRISELFFGNKLDSNVAVRKACLK